MNYNNFNKESNLDRYMYIYIYIVVRSRLVHELRSLKEGRQKFTLKLYNRYNFK